MTEQPGGTVVLTLQLVKSTGIDQYDWWQVSVHSVGSRITFWERAYRTGKSISIELANRVSDEIWDSNSAEDWILSQTNSKLMAGYKPSPNGCDVPPGALADLLGLQGNDTTSEDSP